MFRDIRKKKNQISTEAAEQLLREARRGILAVNGREGYPYAIPINYYYDREAQKIYFHGARAGHKVEPSGPATRCASPSTAARRSGRRRGRRTSGASWCSAGVACWSRARRPWRC